jgi:hypothetical protein
MAHAAAELPELQNRASALLQMMMRGPNQPELRMADHNLPENLRRWETAVAASLAIAISMIVITLVLTSEL